MTARSVALALALALTATAHAQELAVALQGPPVLHVGETAVVRAEVRGAGQWPLLLTPRIEGAAVEVVRGRLLRADAADPHADVLEFRIPIVARGEGAAVLRVAVSGYTCAARCAQSTAEGALILHVAAAASSPKQERTERTSSLGWVRLDGAEGCPSSAEIARAVEERLGRSVFVSAASSQLAVEGRAERTADPPGYRAVIRLTDSGGAQLGERVVESRADDGCAELGALVAVAIAVMIDPYTAPADPPPPAPTPSPPIVIERPGPRWQVEVDASLVGALGLMPMPTIGGLSAFILTPPGFVPILLEGALFPFARAQPSAGHADFLQIHAGLQICPLALTHAQLAFHACAGVDAGAVVVIGGDLNVPEHERVIGQAHVAARLHWRPVGPLVIRVGLHFLVPFRHDAFSYVDASRNTQVFYVPDPVAGLLDLGLGLHFD